MSGYLKRLVSALGAYQLAQAVSMVLAVLLLPLYTHYLPPSAYGIVETLATAVIFVSIVVRLGIIESFLRFYFVDRDRARQDALARRAAWFLLISTTIAGVVLAVPAGPLSTLVLGRPPHTAPGVHPYVADYRVAVLGMWAFTNLELAYALLRVDERLRDYAIVSVSNVALTIVGSVVLVVAFRLRAEGLLIGNYGATTVVLVALWWRMRHRLWLTGDGVTGRLERWSTLLDFGLPTVPAEASVYALSVVDRQYLVHSRGLSAAGLYSLAVKLAGAIAFAVRAFQYAWPPLAYSIEDDVEAARLYALVTTYYVALTGWVVVALSLESRWVIRLLTTRASYFTAYRAVPWVSLGWAMYGLWVVFLVIAGRAKVTRRNFPAAIAGLAVNVILILLLVPHYGIAGAGVALCGAYLAMLAVMYVLVRRVFPIRFEWRRLTHLAVVAAGLTVAGDLLLPTAGAGGLVSRAAVVVALPLVLLATGFAHRAELAQTRELLARMRSYRVAGGGAR